MNFLEALVSNPPIGLKPDRPASVHILSWQQIQLQEAADEIRKQRQQELIYHSDRLAGALRDKDRDFQSQYEKYLQHLLLYQIENERLRSILSQWDAERSKYHEKSKQVDGAHQKRLQMLKMDLTKAFEAQLEEMAHQNNQDLEQIRQLYNRRLAHITSQSHNLEDVIEKLKLECERKNTKIQILEASNEDLLLRLEGKSKQVKDKQVQMNFLKQEFRKYKEDQEEDRQQRYIEYQRKKQEVEGLNQENEELKDVLETLKGTIQEMRDHLTEAELDKIKALEKKEQLVIKCLVLERQIQDFKSRKTQHNNLSDYNKSVHKFRQSPFNSLGVIDLKQGELKSKEILQDSRVLEKEKIDDIFNEKQVYSPRQVEKNDSELVLQLKSRNAELTESLAQLQSKLRVTEGDLIRAEERLRQQEAQIRTLQDRGKNNEEIVTKERIWGERLSNMQRILEQLNQQWLKKQRELSYLFTSIESNYMRKLAQQESMLEQLRQNCQEKQKENKELVQALAQKAIEVGMLQAKKK